MIYKNTLLITRGDMEDALLDAGAFMERENNREGADIHWCVASWHADRNWYGKVVTHTVTLGEKLEWGSNPFYGQT